MVIFKDSGELLIERSCTEQECSWKKPPGHKQAKEDKKGKGNKKRRDPTGGPVLWKDLQTHKPVKDPRPIHLRNLPGYSDHFRKTVVNGYRRSGIDTAFRYAYPHANLYQADREHDYSSSDYGFQYNIDERGQVSVADIARIERQTRDQAKCAEWMDQRKEKITASRHGDVIKAMDPDSRRCKKSLARSLYVPWSGYAPAVIHGITHEDDAIRTFEEVSGMADRGSQVQKCGFFVDEDFCYIGASPDGYIAGLVTSPYLIQFAF